MVILIYFGSTMEYFGYPFRGLNRSLDILIYLIVTIEHFDHCNITYPPQYGLVVY